MGIRFNCPACDRALNVKEEQAGKRGICPYCKAKIEIPPVSTQRQGADASAPAPSAAAMPASSSDAAAGPPGSFHLAASDAAALRGEEASVAAGGQTAPRTQATPPEGAAAGNMRQAQETVPAAGTAAISPGTASAVPSPAAVPPAAGPAADPIAAAPQLRWYVVPPGSTSQYGPASGSELAAWIQQNRVPPESLVWREDWPEWQVAGRVLPQLGGVGGSLPAARQPTVVLPLAPGHLPTAAGPAPLAATSHGSHPTAASAPVGPAATAVGGMLPQALSVGPRVGTVPEQPAAVMAPAALAGAQAAAVPQTAGTAPMAVPAGAVPVATATGAAVAGMAVPPVSTASRYAASRAYSRRKSKTASLVAIIVLVLAIAALTPLVIKVVFYP